jgi:uncharacterized protein
VKGSSEKSPLTLRSSHNNSVEWDCACSDDSSAPAVLPRPPATVTAWQRAPDLYRAPLPGDHELVFNPLGPGGLAVLNGVAQRVLDAFARPGELTRCVAALPGLAPGVASQAAMKLTQLGFLQSERSMGQLDFARPRTLTAWLHVTNACNLRCTYCYLRKTDEAMDEETGRVAVEAVFRSAARHSFQATKFKYAGGEPTLNFPLVCILHQQARLLAQRHGLELHEVLLSNGVALDDDMIEMLHGEGIRLMVSLDGVGAAHDRQRSLPNGSNTFDLVAGTIDRAIARGLVPHLSITVTAQNADGLPEVVAFALERDLPFNLNLYRDNGHASSMNGLAASETELLAAMRAAFAVIEANLPSRSVITSLLDRSYFGYPHDRACGAGHNYLVINQRGGVARCQMELERSVANIQVDDPLVAVQTERDGFQNLPVDERGGCWECAWRYWCGGGCPLLTYRLTGRSDVKSPYCKLYRTLYPELLRLEGLRLLQQQAPPN